MNRFATWALVSVLSAGVLCGCGGSDDSSSAPIEAPAALPTCAPPTVTPVFTPTPQEFPVPGCCEFFDGGCENQSGVLILTCALGPPDRGGGVFFDFHSCDGSAGLCVSPTPTPGCTMEN